MNEPASTVQSVLTSVISAGKAAVRAIAPEDIQRFIASRPGVTGPVTISQVRANSAVGASSGIVLFAARYDTGSGPIERELVLRHAPGSDTRLFFEYDLARQFKVQKALQDTGVPVPEPLWLDANGDFLGVSGYIMALVSGEVPNPSAFTKGPIASASAPDRRSMLEAVMRALVGIHGTDCTSRGLGDFVMNAEGDSPLRKCINWYWQTWEWINQPEFARLVSVRRWLLERAPAGGTTLMHGDSTLHNYMFSGTKLVAVLDWEMSCLGRPEADLALQCVGNELFAAPTGSGMLMPPSQEEWLALYASAGGRKLEHFDYFKKLTAYMVVVAIQSLQRNLSDEVRAAQAPYMMNRLWAMLES